MCNVFVDSSAVVEGQDDDTGVTLGRKLNPPANWIDKLRIGVTCTRCRAARQNHTDEGVVAFAITTPESKSATLSFLVAWRKRG